MVATGKRAYPDYSISRKGEMMGFPKAPGDPAAHVALAERHLALTIKLEEAERRATAAESALAALSADAKDGERMREALEDMFRLIDEGWLVRNLADDGKEGFVMRQLPFVMRLQRARAAIDAAMKEGK